MNFLVLPLVLSHPTNILNWMAFLFLLIVGWCDRTTQFLEFLLTNFLFHLFKSPFFRPLNTTLLANSACPFVCACSTEVKTCYITSSVHNFPNCRLAIWVPLSDTRCLEISKWHTMFFHTKCWTLWAIICATGSASIHLVKYLMATMMYFIWRRAKEKGPKMSIPQVLKGHGLQMITTPRPVHGTYMRASNIVHTARHISHNHRQPIVPYSDEF